MAQRSATLEDSSSFDITTKNHQVRYPYPRESNAPLIGTRLGLEAFQ
jgi:hypothetical protein